MLGKLLSAALLVPGSELMAHGMETEVLIQPKTGCSTKGEG